MKLIGAIALTLAPLALSAAVPASAKSHQLYLYAPDAEPELFSKEEQTSPPRVAAIQECNARARKLGAERDWQFASSAVYGACMFEHGQRFG